LATILARLTAPLGLFIISCCSSCKEEKQHHKTARRGAGQSTAGTQNQCKRSA
jgi:hypothetical protein